MGSSAWLQVFVWFPNHALRTDVVDLDFPVYYNAAVAVSNGAPIYGEARLDKEKPFRSFI